MSSSDVDRYMGTTLSRYGFMFDKADTNLVYAERAAWAVYYHSSDCRLQILWSEREGGVNFMLAPLNAPMEFGLINKSDKWQFMLRLSKLDDDLKTPSVDAQEGAWWKWRIALFETHIDEARAALKCN